MARLTRILSIDGGGVRGILPAQVLVRLERKIRRKSGDPGAGIADCFDMLAGTSTGGLLVCLLLSPDPENPDRPRFTAEDAVRIYLRRSRGIFSVPFRHRIRSLGGIADERYPAAGLERALDQQFGALKLSQLLKPCLITAYDIRRRRAFFFTQQDARRTPGRDFLVRDVARSTAAAPTFFECAQIPSGAGVRYPMIDGSVFANNPALCAYAEAGHALRGHPGPSRMALLSLGSGRVSRPYDYDEARDWGAVEWVRPLIDIMMSGGSETVHYQLERLFGAIRRPERYLRVDTALPPAHADMDNANRGNLTELRRIGERLGREYDPELERFADLLLESRPERRGEERAIPGQQATRAHAASPPRSVLREPGGSGARPRHDG
jgi:patatin-like phospholipase/acyl hydrolase